MQIMHILLGAAGGFVFGYIIGVVLLKKKTAIWEERLGNARDKLESIKKDATSKVEKERAKVQDMEQKLAASKEEISRVKVEMDEQRSTLVDTQTSLQEKDAANAKAMELADAHKMARQQAEGRCKQAETLNSQVQQQVNDLQGQLQGLSDEKATLESEAARQAKEVKRLRAEVAAAGDSGSGIEHSMEIFADAEGSLEGILQALMQAEGQVSAVLSDANGIIVAAAGEADLKEGMAATTKLVGSVTKQLEGMVPFDAMRSYSLTDDKTNVIAGRAFQCAGEVIGLATYGPRLPSSRVVDGAMASLASILE